MTANQIAYQRLQEEKRHNLATEALTKERDQGQIQYWTQSIGLGYDQLAETIANNRLVNDTKLQALAEDVRHHMVSEDQTWYQLDIQQGKLQEDIRSNQAREAEDFRHHTVLETETKVNNEFYRTLEDRKQTYYEESDRDKRSQGWANIAVARQNAATAKQNADTAAGHLVLATRQQDFHESQFVKNASYNGIELGTMHSSDWARVALEHEKAVIDKEHWEATHPWASAEWSQVTKDLLPVAAGVLTAYFTKGKVKLK